jgi:hypothetical protein
VGDLYLEFRKAIKEGNKIRLETYLSKKFELPIMPNIGMWVNQKIFKTI